MNQHQIVAFHEHVPAPFTDADDEECLKFPGAFDCPKTSRIRFCAFSYSIGEPCGRSNQLMMYFTMILPERVESPERTAFVCRESGHYKSRGDADGQPLGEISWPKWGTARLRSQYGKIVKPFTRYHSGHGSQGN